MKLEVTVQVDDPELQAQINELQNDPTGQAEFIIFIGTLLLKRASRRDGVSEWYRQINERRRAKREQGR